MQKNNCTTIIFENIELIWEDYCSEVKLENRKPIEIGRMDISIQNKCYVGWIYYGEFNDSEFEDMNGIWFYGKCAEFSKVEVYSRELELLLHLLESSISENII